MTEVTGAPAMLTERVARLRTDLFASPEGREVMKHLSASGSVQADQAIGGVWEQGWGQSWPQSWPQGYGQYEEDEGKEEN